MPVMSARRNAHVTGRGPPYRRDAQARSATPSARRRRRRVRRSREGAPARRPANSRQARRLARAPAAGIDAASMARRCQSSSQIPRMFSSTRRSAAAAGWAGAPLAGASGATAGGRFRSALVPIERGQDGERAVEVEATEPAESAPSRPDSDARQAGERSPCPPCRSRNSDQREATTTTTTTTATTATTATAAMTTATSAATACDMTRPERHVRKVPALASSVH